MHARRCKSWWRCSCVVLPRTAEKLANDDVPQPEGLGEQPRDLDIAISCAVLVRGDAVPRATTRRAQLQQDVSRISPSAERKREVAASGQSPRDGGAEHLRIRFDRLAASDLQLRADMTNFLHMQRPVPGERTVRRDDLDVTERSLVANEKAQVKEDCDGLAVDIQRSALFQQPDQVGRNAELIAAAEIEQRTKSVPVDFDRQRPPLPLPACKNAVVGPTGLGWHAMAKFVRKITANRESIGHLLRAEERDRRRIEHR